MKKSGKTKMVSSSVWSSLILCAGCIGYVIFKEVLFLIFGILGFTILLVFKK